MPSSEILGGSGNGFEMSLWSSEFWGCSESSVFDCFISSLWFRVKFYLSLLKLQTFELFYLKVNVIFYILACFGLDLPCSYISNENILKN
jgi:hypothetical protein